jgi:hypothetical protein
LTTTSEQKASTRIELVHSSDPHTKLQAGDRGTITNRRQDPWGEIVDVEWDSGSRLSLIAGEDLWTRLVD